MGAWGYKFYENDEAADWLHQFWDTKSFELLVKEVEQFDPSNENYDTIRVIAHILICLNLGAIFTSYITIPELMSFILHEIGHTFSKAILDRNTKYGKVDEKFADQFAAMYGYSSELSSAFTKLGPQEYKITKTLKQVPIVNILVGIGKIMDDLFLGANILL